MVKVWWILWVTASFSFTGVNGPATFIGKQGVDSAATLEECEALKKYHEENTKMPSMVFETLFHCVGYTQAELERLQK